MASSQDAFHLQNSYANGSCESCFIIATGFSRLASATPNTFRFLWPPVIINGLQPNLSYRRLPELFVEYPICNPTSRLSAQGVNTLRFRRRGLYERSGPNGRSAIKYSDIPPFMIGVCPTRVRRAVHFNCAQRPPLYSGLVHHTYMCRGQATSQAPFSSLHHQGVQ